MVRYAFWLPHQRAALIHHAVQASISEVASAFVRPESYTLDIDRLLLGREHSLRTHSVGILQIMIHRAKDLPKTDTLGKFPMTPPQFEAYVQALVTRMLRYHTPSILNQVSTASMSLVLPAADEAKSLALGRSSMIGTQPGRSLRSVSGDIKGVSRH